LAVVFLYALELFPELLDFGPKGFPVFRQGVELGGGVRVGCRLRRRDSTSVAGGLFCVPVALILYICVFWRILAVKCQQTKKPAGLGSVQLASGSLARHRRRPGRSSYRRCLSGWGPCSCSSSFCCSSSSSQSSTPGSGLRQPLRTSFTRETEAKPGRGRLDIPTSIDQAGVLAAGDREGRDGGLGLGG
jgi:hypothetical protein